jgi:uncharacterized protein (DUF362 family)
MSAPPRLAVVRSAAADYPERAPFHPSVAYPEMAGHPVGAEPNPVYDAVRQAWMLAGLDAARLDTLHWNPLGAWIRPGQTVLLKPNLVKETHPRDAAGWRYTITHGSVIRAVADYAWKALEGRGTLIVADAPQTDSSFAAMARLLGLDALADYYRSRGLNFELLDLRREQWTNRGGVIVHRDPLPGDPRGYLAFDLGPSSEFHGHPGAGHYYGADYDSAELNRHHSGGRHEYLVAASAIAADAVISLPKLKTHKKAGITVSLKNLVGINGDKNWLPHHTEANARFAGDERPRISSGSRSERHLSAWIGRATARSPRLAGSFHRLLRLAGRRLFGDTEEVVRSGNWWGNDTIWRTCLDLNKILAYGTASGSFRPPGAPNRKPHLVVVDGILAGQGRGPMNPDPVAAGLVVFGDSAPAVDAACARLMGFDPDRIPIVRQAFHCRAYPLAEGAWADIEIASNEPAWCAPLGELDPHQTFHFEPHFGWTGHIEHAPDH